MVKGRSKRPPKIGAEELLKRLSGLPVRFTFHALERMAERQVLRVGVIKMLRGETKKRLHVPSKDKFERGSWRYRIHGTDVDDEEIRVSVAVEEAVVVVTVFRRD